MCSVAQAALFVNTLETEADDALAAGAERFADADGVERIVICSVDKDLAQCVRGDRVILWGGIRYDDPGPTEHPFADGMIFVPK